MGEKLSNDDIIQALLDLAFYRSAGDASLGDIASSLGIKKSSLYNHFDSREDLLQSALESCKEYIDSINFIPNDYANVAKKYPLETVFKGIALRYFKMHEKSPFFQIYTFVQSQKYFSVQAAQIIVDEKEKFISQTVQMLEALKDAKKISLDSARFYGIALCFVSALNDLVSDLLLKRKKIVFEKFVDCKSLSNLQSDESSIEKINSFAQDFCKAHL